MINPMMSMNQRVVADLIRSVKSNASRGDMTGTNNGPIGVSQFPNGTLFNFDPPGLGVYSFTGVLVNSGPNKEADYKDARYFVREVVVSQPASSTSATLPTININTGAFWGPCTNQLEIPGGTHLLPVYSGSATAALTGITVTIVQVQMVQSAAPGQGNTVFVFSQSAPNSISFQVTSDFDAGTYWGRYKAKSYMLGTATATTPGTLASDEDIILINGSEWGLATSNNLLVAPNTYTFAVIGSGTIVGSVTVSDVVYKIVVAWIGFAGCESGDGGDVEGGSP